MGIIKATNESSCEKTNNVVFEQVRHKLSCTSTEQCQMLEILDIGRRGIVLISVAKTKALISFAVTAKLICAFGFANADCCFSHEVAQICPMQIQQ